MISKRKERLKAVALRRQFNVTVILENVDDTHNVGAVMRTCDSVGINEIYVVYTNKKHPLKKIKLGKRTSAGTRKWLKVHLYTDLEACIKAVRAKYDRILCTHLSESSQSLYDLELTGSVALVFGNEHVGISKDLLKLSDGNFIVPQVGMAQSLNISVACAITLYECFRQRQAKNLYEENTTASPEQLEELVQEYFLIHDERRRGFFAHVKGEE